MSRGSFAVSRLQCNLGFYSPKKKPRLCPIPRSNRCIARLWPNYNLRLLGSDTTLRMQLHNSGDFVFQRENRIGQLSIISCVISRNISPFSFATPRFRITDRDSMGSIGYCDSDWANHETRKSTTMSFVTTDALLRGSLSCKRQSHCRPPKLNTILRRRPHQRLSTFAISFVISGSLHQDPPPFSRTILLALNGVTTSSADVNVPSI